MAGGICVFAENYDGKLEPTVAELVTAAYHMREITGERVKAVLVAENPEPLIEELAALGVEEVLAYKTSRDTFLQDDALSTVIADMIRRMDPASVLIPATQTGRSVFSRAAVKLGSGMTADCTELLVGKREDDTFYIKQNKPSYGEHVFVTIVTKENISPQMMTVRPGVFKAREKEEGRKADVRFADDIKLPESGIEVIAICPARTDTDNMMAAELVVACGRGVLKGDNFELMNRFAAQLQAAVGGTRPLADSGLIPFEHQIGQTGCTIRPKICISLGASGAIQHTEGIKDTKLMIAINEDKNAPIFNIADYGFVCDMREILEAFLE